MKLGARIARSAKVLKAIWGWGNGPYDAAHQSIDRGARFIALQDARTDISSYSRAQVAGLARDQYRNNPIVHVAVDRIVLYALGIGLIPLPLSSSNRFNVASAKRWQEWAPRADVSRRMGWGTLNRVALRAILIDGDAFMVKTRHQDGSPAVQLIEGHRCANPPDVPAGNSGWFDGVRIDQTTGEALAYSFLTKFPDGREVSRRVPSDQVVHLMISERPEQYRGISALSSCLTMAQDIMEILKFELVAVKSLSAVDKVVKLKGGEQPIEDLGRLNETNAAVKKVEPDQYYRNQFGVETRLMAPGDEFEAFEHSRPSPSFNGFIDYLTAWIGQTIGLPPAVFAAAKMGGADTRRDMAMVARIAEVIQQGLGDGFNQVWEYVVGLWIDAGDRGFMQVPKDWDHVEWQTPKSMTVDAGRDAKTDLEDLRSGAITYQEFCGRYGVDYRRHIEQLALEQTLVDEGDPSGRLFERMFGIKEEPEVEEENETDDSEQPPPGEENQPERNGVEPSEVAGVGASRET